MEHSSNQKIRIWTHEKKKWVIKTKVLKFLSFDKCSHFLIKKSSLKIYSYMYFKKEPCTDKISGTYEKYFKDPWGPWNETILTKFHHNTPSYNLQITHFSTNWKPGMNFLGMFTSFFFYFLPPTPKKCCFFFRQRYQYGYLNESPS